jgi:serine/threonine-protein kinase
MTHKKIIFFLLTLFLVTGSGCNFGADSSDIGTVKTNTQNIPEFITYKSTMGEIQINYPSAWTKLEDDQALATFASPLKDKNDTFNENVIVDYFDFPTEGPPIQLSQQARDTARLIQKTHANKKFKLLDSKAVSTSNLSVWQNTYTYQNEKKLALEVRQYFILQNNRGYIITFSAEEKEFDSYLTTVNKMLASLKITH